MLVLEYHSDTSGTTETVIDFVVRMEHLVGLHERLGVESVRAVVIVKALQPTLELQLLLQVDRKLHKISAEFVKR